MTGAAAYAELPVGRRTIDSPVNNQEQATLETTRVLFFAHDTISDREKRELPFKEFGGIHLPHIATLRDTKHMLYKCRLTQLPAFAMIGDWDVMLPPADRQHWSRSFTQTVIENGEVKTKVVDGFLESRIDPETGEFKQRKSNHIVFNKRYPLNEARFAQKRFGTHVPGGVVEIEALIGASLEEIEEAQYFFFPKWDAVIRGEELLPETTKGLQAHLKSRIDTIKDQLWDGAKKAKYHSIGKDMIRSSTEYHRTVTEAIRTDEVVHKSAFTKGDTNAVPSVISEKYLEQTEGRRKDDIVTGEYSGTQDLVKEMRAEREEKGEIAKTRLLLEERKQYVAEIQAGLRERDDEEEIRLGIKKTSEPKVDVSVTKSVEVPKGLQYLANHPEEVVDSSDAPSNLVEVIEPSLPENTEGNTVATEPPANTEAFEVEGISNRTAMGEKEASYNIGDKIPVAGGEAEVIAKPFGRIKVRLADGTETMLDKL